MPTFEYKCESCSVVTEDIRKIAERHDPMECPACGGKAQFIVSTPTIGLDGISGDFPTASDRWAKLREQRVKAERKLSYSGE